MIGVAAGLALAGHDPLRVLLRLLPGRPLRDDPDLGRLHRRHRSSSSAPTSGVAIGEDGYTQMGLEDIACLRALPNIPIVQPADELETKQAVAYAVEHPGPIYLRLTRQNLEPVHDAAYRFQFGRADVLRPGHDVTLLATGGPVWNALEAAKQLEADGIRPRSSTSRPSSRSTRTAILRSAGRTGHVVTVEDHSDPRRPGRRRRRAARRGDAHADEADRGDGVRRVRRLQGPLRQARPRRRRHRGSVRKFLSR